MVDAKMEGKVKGIMGWELYFTAMPEKSSKRFLSNTKLRFLAKLNTDEDPQGFVSITSGLIKKDKRRFIFDSRKMSGAVRDVSKNIIPVSVEKLKDKIFLITVINNLSPGEYAFKPFKTTDLNGSSSGQVSPNQTIFCFGID
jgi:hypothetical protein